MNTKITKLLLVGLTLLVFSCKKDSVPDVPGQKFEDSGTYLILSNSNWYTAKDNFGFGTVSVKFSGVTNADKLTIATFGDGVSAEQPVTLSGKKFDQDDVILFTHAAASAGQFDTATKLKAYRGKNVLEIPISSGTLQY